MVAATPTPNPPELLLVDGFVKGRISIIMPAYNEVDCIVKSVLEVEKQFGALCIDLEIIVVDDGSTDGTRKVVEEMANGRVKVVGYPRNQGKGHALKLGSYSATGQFTFFVDSDLEIQAKELWAYVKVLESADIVIGSKRHPLSSVETPVIRGFLSLAFNILERLLTGVRTTDTQAGLKAAKSVVLYKILPLLSVKKYAFDAELLAVASLLNLRIRELPVHISLSARFSVRQVFRMLIDLLGIAYRLRIRRWYQQSIKSASHTYRPIIPW